MNNRMIADVYAANDTVREQLKQMIENMPAEKTDVTPEGEKWSIAHLVEHISIVEEGMSKISAKLLTQAQVAGKTSDGSAKMTENFTVQAAKARDLKLEAPERVRPTGNQTIAESLAKMEDNKKRLEDLRPLFESVECSDFTFPHPAFGELTAHEWLTLIGGHEARHLRQLKTMLDKVE